MFVWGWREVPLFELCCLKCPPLSGACLHGVSTHSLRTFAAPHLFTPFPFSFSLSCPSYYNLHFNTTQERNSANIPHPVRLMERSVFSDRMVFVRAVKESGWMGDVELAVYDSWFGPILDSNPSLVPDGFIYLRCTPDTCMERCVQTQLAGRVCLCLCLGIWGARASSRTRLTDTG